MSPEQAARAALCLADALDVVADEMGREDACQEIITAHSEAGEDLCDALRGGYDIAKPPWWVSSYPETALPAFIQETLRSDKGPSVADLNRWADVWRAWGESTRIAAGAPQRMEEVRRRLRS